MEKVIIKVELETNEYMDIELYPDYAPITVKNFLELVDKKYFDNLIFHRIIKDFMVQAGGYYYDEKSKSLDYPEELKPIKGEFKSNGVNNPLLHKKGVISMARTRVKDSATSQFFICTQDTPHLDGEYAAFGNIIGEESFKTLEHLNDAHIVNAGSGFTTFPYPVIRIKTIKRVNND